MPYTIRCTQHDQRGFAEWEVGADDLEEARQLAVLIVEDGEATEATIETADGLEVYNETGWAVL